MLKSSKLNSWKNPTRNNNLQQCGGRFVLFLWTFWCIFDFLTATVCKVLILSALSGTKETAGVAGAGTQSAVVRSGDVGGTWLHLNLEMEPKYLMKSDVQ